MLFTDYFMNKAIILITCPMRKSLKNNEQGSNQIHKIVHLSYQLCLASFTSVLEGIIKRVKCQTLCKVIIHSSPYNKKMHRLKIMQYIADRSLKEKKQQAFNRIRQNGQDQKVRLNTAKNLSMVIKRIAKEKLNGVFARLKGRDIEPYSRIQDNKKSRQSIKSGRLSQQSHVFSVSQSSLLSSRLLHFQQSKQYSRQEIIQFRIQSEQLKRMALSEEAKQSLLKMQRYDRYTYNTESQKILKEPITEQYRRLEKMKNEHREMRSKYYDNQLTVTCLYNHVKYVSQMNRQIGDINALKAKVADLDKRIADASALHRKEISQYKKKLLFLDTGSKTKIQQKETITDSRTSIQESVSSLQLNNDEQTTYNILIIALKGKSYADVRREIDHFLKISTKERLMTIFKEMINMIADLQSAEKQKSNAEKSKADILNSLNSFDRYLREEKAEEMEKLKNKSKVQSPLELTELFQTVIATFQQIKKMRKKEAASNEKPKKGFEKEYEDQKIEIKKLQARIKQLQEQKQKLADNLKKSRLSLPPTPRRKSSDKEAQPLSKLSQSDSKLQKEVQRLIKQKELLVKSSQIAQETANKEYSQLQEELNRLKSKLKQFQDGFKYSSLIRQKKDSKQPFTREINQFKRMYPSSIFTDYFIRIQNEQSTKLSIVTQIKGIISFFNEQNWKKRPNFQIKIDGEVFTLLNSVIQMMYSLYQKEEEHNKDLIDWKNSYSSIEAEKITLEEQINSLKKEYSMKQKQLQTSKEQNERMRKENTALQTTIFSYQQSLSKYERQAEAPNPNTPSKVSSRQNDQNSQDLLKENQLLRLKLQQLQCRAAQSPTTYRSPIMQLSESKSSASKNQQTIEKAKELYDFLKYYEQIKRKKLSKLDYMKEMQELKMDYPDSPLVEILQNYLNVENHHISLADHREDTLKLQIDRLKNQLDQKQRTTNEKIEQLTLKLQQTNQQINDYYAKISQLLALLQQSNSIIDKKSTQYQQLTFELAQSKAQVDFLAESLDKSNAELILAKRREKSISPINEEPKRDRSNSISPEKIEIIRNKLTACQQKLANYKIGFDKLKAQRDNLNLLLDQKNEEYENCKESLQKYQQNHKTNQTKIEQLQRNVSMTEHQFKALETQANKLLFDKSTLLAERITIQDHYNTIMKSKQVQIEKMKLICEDRERKCVSLQYEIQQSRRKSELDMAHLHQQRNYLFKNLEAAEQEIIRIRSIHEEEIQEYRKKYERSNIEMNQYRENVELERQLLRQKVTEFTRITETSTSNHLLQDHQKAQLRRQLDLLNSQLANIIRNNQNQLRQSRRYIQQLINEVQNKEVLHNEQRKILKQSIERARNEQYEINQEKIRQLRQDIQDLRQQNERLISIIDSNEAPFNKLVHEHKDMHQAIMELQELNASLQQENVAAQQQNSDLMQGLRVEQAQKQSLSNELEILQQKLSSFELRIATAINEGQLKEELASKENKEKIANLQQRITHLNQQNGFLTTKSHSQAQEIMKLRNQLIRLQMELSKQMNHLERSHHQNIQSKNSEYSQYLQEKLYSKEMEIKISQEAESEIRKKFEQLMGVFRQMQGEKQHLISCLQHQQLNFNASLANWQNDLALLQAKIKQLEAIINTKNEEIKQRIVSINHDQRITELEAIISQIEVERGHLLLQNNRLSHTINQQTHRIASIQQKLSQHQTLVLENKRLVNKLNIVQEDARQYKYSLSQYSAQITLLQDQLKQAKTSVQLNPIPVFSVQKILSQEIQWLRKQLDLRNQDICKLNNKNTELLAEIKRIEQVAAQLQQNQNRYNRESQLLEQSKSKIRKLQLTITNYAYSKQKAEESFTYQTIQKDREISLLSETIQDLRKKYETTKSKFMNQTKEENHFLLEIARKLDENYDITDQQEKMEISTLKKISRQIGQLIEMNTRYKQKCEFMETQGYQLRIQEAEYKIASSLRLMYVQLLSFLKNNEIINPEQSNNLPEGLEIDKVIIELGFLLKELFASLMKNNQEEITRYNSIIRDIRAMIDQAYLTKNLETMNRLRQLLTQAQYK